MDGARGGQQKPARGFVLVLLNSVCQKSAETNAIKFQGKKNIGFLYIYNVFFYFFVKGFDLFFSSKSVL
jgi:hypothetical protein